MLRSKLILSKRLKDAKKNIAEAEFRRKVVSSISKYLYQTYMGVSKTEFSFSRVHLL